MKLPDKIYDALKVIVWIAPPFLTFVLGLINAIQTGELIAIVTAVIGGIGTLAGTLLEVSCINYNKEQ